ncbi:MAG: dentin sialophosphoprotein [Parcubacteria group bacterium Athens0416_74]|nr:MAG: dentin sialophosphoprotein [Parcubacteria group bacterium Athens0416_74]
MKKQLILGAVLSIMAFGFGFPSSAFAAQGGPIPGIDYPLGFELLIASSDLGVENVGTLPTSPFYFLKEWKRGFSRLFTFDAVAKAELELKVTNEKAAEALEVEKLSASDAGDLHRALQNFTDAQARLSAQLTKLSDISENPNVAELMKRVDEKTAKHIELLEHISERWSTDPYAEDAARQGGIGDPDFDLLIEEVQDALENTREIFTATVSSGAGAGTPTGSVSFLKQKASDQIESASTAIKEANDVLMQVSTTRGVSRPSTGDDADQNTTVPKQTQGTTFGEKAKIDDSGDSDGLDIFDRWGKLIAKAREHLAEAKKAFAEGKYGEAYGLARSAEAVVGGAHESEDGVEDDDTDDLDDGSNEDIDDRTDDDNKSDKDERTSATSTTGLEKQSSEIHEDESPKPSDREKASSATTSTSQQKDGTESSERSDGSSSDR